MPTASRSARSATARCGSTPTSATTGARTAPRSSMASRSPPRDPGSGRKALYVGSQNSMWIEGMPRDESEALLQRLFEIAEDPAIIYEHFWKVGDLIMWDNLACPARAHRLAGRAAPHL